jgi:uncharacterized protein (TIGR03067 family)
MKTALLSSAAGLALLAAPPAPTRADDKDKPKGDLARLQGTWTTKAGREGNIPVVLRIEGRAVTVKFTNPQGQDIEIKGQVAVDDAAKPHKTIDWVKFTNPMGEDAPDNLGIYTFEDDDTVKVCNGGPGNERPAEFKAGEGGPPQLFVMKREAAKKGDGAKKEEPKPAS